MKREEGTTVIEPEDSLESIMEGLGDYEGKDVFVLFRDGSRSYHTQEGRFSIHELAAGRSTRWFARIDNDKPHFWRLEQLQRISFKKKQSEQSKDLDEEIELCKGAFEHGWECLLRACRKKRYSFTIKPGFA